MPALVIRKTKEGHTVRLQVNNRAIYRATPVKGKSSLKRARAFVQRSLSPDGDVMQKLYYQPLIRRLSLEPEVRIR